MTLAVVAAAAEVAVAVVAAAELTSDFSDDVAGASGGIILV